MTSNLFRGQAIQPPNSPRRFEIHKISKISALCLALLSVQFACTTAGERDLDARAVKPIRTIQTAEVQYHSMFGVYADLSDLGPRRAKLISTELAGGQSGGYKFSVIGEGEHYKLWAEPLNGNNRSLSSDERLVIRVWDSQAPPKRPA
jgi:hypothetical protein